MTHAIVIVLTKNDDWKKEVDEKMAPYQEDNWVDFSENAKYDWYEVGNRYEGWIKLKDGKQTSVALISEIDPKWLTEHCPHSIITLDGKWHEWASLGWWGNNHLKEKPLDIPQPPSKILFEEVDEELNGYKLENGERVPPNPKFAQELGEMLAKYYAKGNLEYTLKPKRLTKKDKNTILKYGEIVRIWWKSYYQEQFIKPLSPDIRMVIVDYHK